MVQVDNKSSMVSINRFKLIGLPSPNGLASPTYRNDLAFLASVFADIPEALGYYGLAKRPAADGSENGAQLDSESPEPPRNRRRVQARPVAHEDSDSSEEYLPVSTRTRPVRTRQPAAAAELAPDEDDEALPVAGRKGAFLPDEDARIIAIVGQMPDAKWGPIATEYNRGLNPDQQRALKSIRERWINQLDPKVDNSPITGQEIGQIVDIINSIGVSSKGVPWASVAKILNGDRVTGIRTDNHVKNTINTQVKAGRLRWSGGRLVFRRAG